MKRLAEPLKLQHRMRLAEVYETETEVSNALDTFESWRQFIAAFPKKRDKPTTGTCAECGDKWHTLICRYEILKQRSA